MANLSHVNFNGKNVDIKDEYMRQQNVHKTVDNYQADVPGDYTINAGDITETAENITLHSKHDLTVDVDGTATLNSTGDIKIDSAGTTLLHNVKDLTLAANGTISLVTDAYSIPVRFPDLTVDLRDLGLKRAANVLKYGAKADGVTDDTDAFNRAIAVNKCIYVPSGTYLINGTLNLEDVRMIGDGQSLWYDQRIATKTTLIIKSTQSARATIIEDLTIYESLTRYFINTTTLFDANTNGLFLNRVSIQGYDTAINYGVLCTVNECLIAQCKIGLSSLIDSKIVNSYIYANGELGIYMGDGSGDTTISNNKIEWNGNQTKGGGIRFENAKHVVVSSNIFDRNGKRAVDIQNSYQIALSANYYARSYDSAVVLSNSYQITDYGSLYCYRHWEDNDTSIIVPNDVQIYAANSRELNFNVITDTNNNKNTLNIDNCFNATNFVVNGNNLQGVSPMSNTAFGHTGDTLKLSLGKRNNDTGYGYTKLLLLQAANNDYGRVEAIYLLSIIYESVGITPIHTNENITNVAATIKGGEVDITFTPSSTYNIISARMV